MRQKPTDDVPMAPLLQVLPYLSLSRPPCTVDKYETWASEGVCRKVLVCGQEIKLLGNSLGCFQRRILGNDYSMLL